ncbi:MAG: hypothetical protein ACSHXZ_09410 [Gammaproteobacteria bacterium]
MGILEILERLVGHLAWPVAVFLIVREFSNEFKSFIRRIKNAKYKDVELNLTEEFQSIKNEAIDAGITIAYPPSAFPSENLKSIETAPEWTIIQSWQEIERVLSQLYSKSRREAGDKSKANPNEMIAVLLDNGTIDPAMAGLINRINTLRNNIVHQHEFELTRGEAMEWMGISKSVKDRLSQRLRDFDGI